jgi:hypothetical protein
MLHRTHNSLDLNPGRGTAHCQRIALLANTAAKTLIQAPMAFTFYVCALFLTTPLPG